MAVRFGSNSDQHENVNVRSVSGSSVSLAWILLTWGMAQNRSAVNRRESAFRTALSLAWRIFQPSPIWACVGALGRAKSGDSNAQTMRVDG